MARKCTCSTSADESGKSPGDRGLGDVDDVPVTRSDAGLLPFQKQLGFPFKEETDPSSGLAGQS